jgi:hypothetical protein
MPKNGFVGAPQWSSQGPVDGCLAQITAAEVHRSLSGTAGPGLPVAEIPLPAASLRSPRPAARDRVVDGLRRTHRSGQASAPLSCQGDTDMSIARSASAIARFGVRMFFFAALVFTLPSMTASAAPEAELWERWTAHNAASTATIDHSAWERFLRANLVRGRDGINRLAYGRVTAADRSALARYLDALAVVPISRYTRDEQLAYWVNLYNALTVKVVLAHYPVDSIRDIDISPGFFADGPWDRKLVKIEGEAVSLNDIEHRILRPIWRDPRIHYAVNCASIGCPNLHATAFTAANSDSLLEAAAREYVNSPRGTLIDGESLTVSKIYAWFQEDFGNSDRNVIKHLARYAKPDLAMALRRITEIGGYQYDWSLNDIPPS